MDASSINDLETSGSKIIVKIIYENGFCPKEGHTIRQMSKTLNLPSTTEGIQKGSKDDGLGSLIRQRTGKIVSQIKKRRQEAAAGVVSDISENHRVQFNA